MRKQFYFKTRQDEIFKVEIVNNPLEIINQLETITINDIIFILFKDGNKRLYSLNNLSELDKVNLEEVESMVLAIDEEKYIVYGNYSISCYGMVKPAKTTKCHESIKRFIRKRA